MAMLHGRCLCGDTTWRTPDPLELPHHCHCSICRRLHGTGFASVAAVAVGAFRLQEGAAGTITYAPSPGSLRRACARCGSPLPSSFGDQMFVSLGQIDEDPGVRPLAHIFVASKAPWDEIADDLPRFDTFPPGFDAPVLPDRPTSPPPPGVVRGSCQCETVAYEIRGPVGPFQHCHCARCRRARGAAHATNLFAALAHFRWTRGEDAVAVFALPGAARFAQAFCRACGGKLPRVNAALGYVVVPAGSLDDDPGVRPERHIFVGSKAPWLDIADALPQHEEYPPPA